METAPLIRMTKRSRDSPSEKMVSSGRSDSGVTCRASFHRCASVNPSRNEVERSASAISAGVVIGSIGR